MNTFSAEVGTGTRYHIHALAHFCGEDLSVSICGGERAHIGAVSLAVYEPERDSATVSTLTVFTHRDDRVSRRAAKFFSRALRCTVCVSAGLHIDMPADGELETLLENCDECCAALVRALKKAQAPILQGPIP